MESLNELDIVMIDKDEFLSLGVLGSFRPGVSTRFDDPFRQPFRFFLAVLNLKIVRHIFETKDRQSTACQRNLKLGAPPMWPHIHGVYLQK